MSCTIPQILAALEPFRSEALVSGKAVERMAALPSSLWPLCDIAGFECRLGPDEDRVDLQLCLIAALGGRRSVSDALAPIREAAARVGGRWRGSAVFLDEWVRPESLLGRYVPVVWLEVDFDDSGDAPFVVFTLDQPLSRGEAVSHVPVRDVIRDGLDRAAGGRLDPLTWATVDRCLDQLPPSARVFHAAVRPMATGDVVRLITKLPWRTLPPYLERIAWPGAIADLNEFLKRYCASTLLNLVHLDLAHEVLPRISVEFYFRSSPRTDSRWQQLFDRLVDEGACSAAKRAALEEWWNVNATDEIQRDVLVKLVRSPGRRLEAKAYLPFGLRSHLRAA